MEKNTFATSAYIAAPQKTVFDYLCSLKNLDEWTLYSRMIEQVDENTWIGTASGYQKNLYYHVRKIENLPFYGIEWHCGFEYNQYFQVYPVVLFPSQYINPSSDETGVYFHWLSFVDPRRRTPMIMEGIHTVHTSECRSLKATLERQTGLTQAAVGEYTIHTDTIYVDAPVAVGAEFVGDIRNLSDWCHLLNAKTLDDKNSDKNSSTPESGEFLDEYNQRVKVTFRSHNLGQYYLIEQDYEYPDHQLIQRSPTFLIPCSYTFGDPNARGFIQHRMTFWSSAQRTAHGRLQIEDYGAESMNIKRLVEAKAGQLETFAQGMSYIPRELAGTRN